MMTGTAGALISSRGSWGLVPPLLNPSSHSRENPGKYTFVTDQNMVQSLRLFDRGILRSTWIICMFLACGCVWTHTKALLGVKTVILTFCTDRGPPEMGSHRGHTTEKGTGLQVYANIISSSNCSRTLGKKLLNKKFLFQWMRPLVSLDRQMCGAFKQIMVFKTREAEKCTLQS